MHVIIDSIHVYRTMIRGGFGNGFAMKYSIVKCSVLQPAPGFITRARRMTTIAPIGCGCRGAGRAFALDSCRALQASRSYARGAAFEIRPSARRKFEAELRGAIPRVASVCSAIGCGCVIIATHQELACGADRRGGACRQSKSSSRRRWRSASPSASTDRSRVPQAWCWSWGPRPRVRCDGSQDACWLSDREHSVQCG